MSNKTECQKQKLREYCKQYSKQYRILNQEKIRSYRKSLTRCRICDKIMKQCSLYNHKKTSLHLTFLNNKFEKSLRSYKEAFPTMIEYDKILTFNGRGTFLKIMRRHPKKLFIKTEHKITINFD